MNKISVLALGDGYCGRITTCFAEDSSFNLHLLSNDRRDPSQFSRYCRSFRSYSRSLNQEEQLEIIIRRIQETHADVLLAVHLWSVRLVSLHQEMLSKHVQLCFVPTLQTLEMVHDKWVLHQFLCKHSLPSPSTTLIRNTPEFWDEVSMQQYPVVTKLRSASNGAQMKVYESYSSLVEDKYRIEQLSESAVVQTFITGRDIDISVLCKDGEVLAYTIQRSALPRRNPFSTDRAIEFFEDEKTLYTVRTLVKLLKWNGVANFDILADRNNDKRMVIDFNPRYWSSMCGSLLAGVNFPVIACYAALGLPLPEHQQKLVRYIWPIESIYQAGRQLFDRRGPKFYYHESGLRYIFKDPVVYVSLFFSRLGNWKVLKRTLFR